MYTYHTTLSILTPFTTPPLLLFPLTPEAPLDTSYINKNRYSCSNIFFISVTVGLLSTCSCQHFCITPKMPSGHSAGEIGLERRCPATTSLPTSKSHCVYKEEYGKLPCVNNSQRTTPNAHTSLFSVHVLHRIASGDIHRIRRIIPSSLISGLVGLEEEIVGIASVWSKHARPTNTNRSNIFS